MNKNHSTKSYNPDNPQILAILIQTKMASTERSELDEAIEKDMDNGGNPEHLPRQSGENHITSQKLPICNLFKPFLFFLLLPPVIL
ncbi:MAG: hypothetical protein H3C54_01190 [Taibaiella sp.]|nr:hypothetical protein [Taibaiella sp.]